MVESSKQGEFDRYNKV